MTYVLPLPTKYWIVDAILFSSCLAALCAYSQEVPTIDDENSRQQRSLGTIRETALFNNMKPVERKGDLSGDIFSIGGISNRDDQDT